MITDPMTFRNNYRKTLNSNDYVVITRFKEPAYVCVKFDPKLKNMQTHLKNAHRETLEYINDNS